MDTQVEARSVAWTALTTIFLVVLGLLASIITARLLGPERQGAVSLYIVFASTIAQLAGLGAQSALTYFFHRKKGERQQVWQTYLFQLAVVALPASLLVSLFFRPEQGSAAQLNGVLAGLLMLITLFRASLLGAFYSLENYRLANVYALIGDQAFSFATLILAAAGALSVTSLLIATCALSFTSLVAQQYQLTRAYGLRFIPWPVPALAGSFFRYGVSAFGTTFLRILNQRSVYALVAQRFGLHQLGIFSVAYGIAERVPDVTRPLLTVAQPKSVRLVAGDQSEGVQYVVKRAATAAALLLLLFPPAYAVVFYGIPILYGDAYRASVVPALLLLPGAFLYAHQRILALVYTATNTQVRSLVFQGTSLAFLGVSLIVLGSSLSVAALLFSVGQLLTSLLMAFDIARSYGVPMRQFLPGFSQTFSFIRTQCSQILRRSSQS